jgi:hypothetical protein
LVLAGLDSHFAPVFQVLLVVQLPLEVPQVLLDLALQEALALLSQTEQVYQAALYLPFHQLALMDPRDPQYQWHQCFQQVQWVLVHLACQEIQVILPVLEAQPRLTDPSRPEVLLDLDFHLCLENLADHLALVGL